MSFKFECPHCSQRIAATIELIGTPATCPTCEQALVVPKPPEGKAIAEASAPDRPKGVVARESRLVALIIIGVVSFSGIALWRSAQSNNSPTKVQPSASPRTEETKLNDVAVELQPTPHPKIAETKWPTSDPEQFARAIMRVNTQLLEGNSMRGQKISNPAMLELAIVQLVSRSSSISTHGCPDEFVAAWQRYVAALHEMSSGLRTVVQAGQGGRFQNEQDQAAGMMMMMSFMATTEQLGSAEKGLESAAARYGVKWKKMSE